MREQANLLDGVTDVAAQANRIPISRGFIFYDDLTFVAHKQPVNQLKRSGFARAAASQQNQRLSCEYAQVEIADQRTAGRSAIGYIKKLNCGVSVGSRHAVKSIRT